MHRLAERRIGVAVVNLQHVDRLDAEPPQALLDLQPDRGGARVLPDDPPGTVAVHALEEHAAVVRAQRRPTFVRICTRPRRSAKAWPSSSSERPKA